MKTTFSSQYGMTCAVPEDGATAQQVIDHCYANGAVRHVDGIEFVVQLREDVGPELWTEESLRLSLPAEDRCRAQTEHRPLQPLRRGHPDLRPRRPHPRHAPRPVRRPDRLAGRRPARRRGPVHRGLHRRRLVNLLFRLYGWWLNCRAHARRRAAATREILRHEREQRP